LPEDGSGNPASDNRKVLEKRGGKEDAQNICTIQSTLKRCQHLKWLFGCLQHEVERSAAGLIIEFNDRFGMQLSENSWLDGREVIDPNRPDVVLQTGQSIKSRICELEGYKAAVGNLNQSAIKRRS
jgi:hypothetical protein